MSWFAGAVARSEAAQPSLARLDGQTQRWLATRRLAPGAVTRATWRGGFVTHASVGAVPGCGVASDESGALLAIAGEPLIDVHAAWNQRRASEARRLLAALSDGSIDTTLAGSRGSFALAMHDERSGDTLLATDKLGVRPVFHLEAAGLLLFATSLSFLRRIAAVREVDWRGLAEILQLGYAFEDRTQYAGVRSLRPGALLRLPASGAPIERRYFDLAEVARRSPRGGYDPAAVGERLREAIRIRLGGQRRVAAFLSGGFDSRAICAFLSDDGVQVRAATYGAPGSQDEYCASRAAQALGVTLDTLPQTPSSAGDSHSKATTGGWIDALEHTQAVDAPRAVWSGDGGSVHLGLVYMNQRAFDDAAAGRLRDALLRCQPATAYLGCLKPGARARLAHAFGRSLDEEVGRLQGMPPERSVYVFLSQNDQRRHMYGHFDEVLDGGFDLVLPFFDADLVEAILAQPLTKYLNHAGYVDLFGRCIPKALEAPWQAYPGHATSPLEIPEGISYQWSKQKNEYLSRMWRSQSLRDFGFVARRLALVADEVSLSRFALGFARQWMSRRDYGYVVRAPKAIAEIKAI